VIFGVRICMLAIFEAVARQEDDVGVAVMTARVKEKD
jgi:hypothetical protein